jgi:pimeloyl-ACP methyl ester carboxylesterase
MTLDTLEAVQVGGSTQWIRIRGAKGANPTLLLIQQGPGLPMINEARRLERDLRLEDSFNVVYWDQRGCGLSLRRSKDRVAASLELGVDDTLSLLELLRDRFGKRTHVAGFSSGATLGAYAASRRPDLVAALVAVEMCVDGAAAGTHTRLLGRLFLSLVTSHDYSWIDVVRTVNGIRATQAALLEDMATLDLIRTLPSLTVPIVMVQGRLDQGAPGEAAQHYFHTLKASCKALVWFEKSAHTPHLEEPARFRELLMRVRAGEVATPGRASPEASAASGPPLTLLPPDGGSYAGHVLPGA